MWQTVEQAVAAAEKLGERKTYISDVFFYAGTELSYAEFKAYILEAHELGLIWLSRADMAPRNLTEQNSQALSEISYLNATFHYICTK